MQQIARTSTVTVSDQEYQVRKMTAAVGSYIWQLLMAACFKAQQSMPDTKEQPSTKPEEESSAEEKLRGLCGIAFMHLDFKDYEFIQTNSLKVISRVESVGAASTPLPIMTDSGQWAVPEIADDLMLVTRLMVEAIVFNLSSFLAGSGPATA
jgi:hypothetical protein